MKPLLLVTLLAGVCGSPAVCAQASSGTVASFPTSRSWIMPFPPGGPRTRLPESSGSS